MTVHLDGNRYRGRYSILGNKLIVSAFGLVESSVELAVLGGERGDALVNLAKLVLIDMVRDAVGSRSEDPGLNLQGSTTDINLEHP